MYVVCSRQGVCVGGGVMWSRVCVERAVGGEMAAKSCGGGGWAGDWRVILGFRSCFWYAVKFLWYFGILVLPSFC